MTDLGILYLLAAQASDHAVVNFVDPFGVKLSPVNSPTFTADQGYTGNGTTAYLNTQRDPSSEISGFVQNSAHMSYYVRDTSSVTGVEVLAGIRDSVGSERLYDFYNSSRTALQTFNNQTSTSGAASTLTDNGTGFILSQRTGSTVGAVYQDGTQVGTITQTSTAAPFGQDLFLLARNDQGSADSFCNAQISAFTSGASLDSGQRTALQSHIETYLTTVGAI